MSITCWNNTICTDEVQRNILLKLRSPLSFYFKNCGCQKVIIIICGLGYSFGGQHRLGWHHQHCSGWHDPSGEAWTFLSPSGRAGVGWPLGWARSTQAAASGGCSLHPSLPEEVNAMLNVCFLPCLEKLRAGLGVSQRGQGDGLDAELHQALPLGLGLNSISATSRLCSSGCFLTPVSSCASENNNSPGGLLTS